VFDTKSIGEILFGEIKMVAAAEIEQKVEIKMFSIFVPV